MTTSPRVSRRQFLKASSAVGGGLAIQVTLPGAALAKDAKPASTAAPTEVTHWIVINPDDSVIIRIARSEMGQGSQTGLAQLVAEELDCDWNKVTTEFASPNEHLKRKRIWVSMSTGGSVSIRGSHEFLRKAGAGAREMLTTAAAAKWNVPVTECVASKGVITHKPSKRKVSYGKVAADASKLEIPKDPKLKDPKDWTIAGQSLKRLDIPDKVRGKPVFGIDVRLPGMLHASIVHSPVFGGKVKALGTDEAEKMRGVKGIVRQDEWVAVVADNWWRANEAAKKLKIDWDNGKYGDASDATILAMFREGLEDPKMASARKVGDAPEALKSAAKVIEAEYYSPYLNHATMEPMTATAWWKEDGTLDVWTSTQNGEGAIAAASETSGLSTDKVEIHKMMLGGGFGRRGAQEYVKQAVIIAKAFPNKPVKLIWSREEDMQHGLYRPASLVKMKAGLDANGKMVAIHSKIACPSILVGFAPDRVKDGLDFTAIRTFNDSPYQIPNDQCDYAMRNGHVPVWFWRAPGLQNSFYRECFIDECAHAAGKDPLEYRLSMLKDGDKSKGVLQAVAKAANWGSPLPKGVARGIAVSDGFGSFTAMVAEVSVDAKGAIKVHRIVHAIDSGYVVNPQACRAQAEGNVIFNMGQLYEANTIKDGRVVESNFHDFPLPGMAQMPKVETVFASTGGFWGGHGEPGALCVVPAILNAVFAATGKRVRTLPLKDGVVA